MSGTSNVGQPSVYEAGDQKNSKAGANDREAYHEGKTNSHLPNDPKDERSIANKLAREEKRQNESEPESKEVTQSKKDSTMPAAAHGNEPSKGAKIDQELREEDQEAEKKKGQFGHKS
ncbi:hypothetical protein MBLNU230_g2980t1 [Neophaeotheca triangularis]